MLLNSCIILKIIPNKSNRNVKLTVYSNIYKLFLQETRYRIVLMVKCAKIGLTALLEYVGECSIRVSESGDCSIRVYQSYCHEVFNNSFKMLA